MPENAKQQAIEALKALPLDAFDKDDFDAAEFVDHAHDFVEAMKLARAALASLESEAPAEQPAPACECRKILDVLICDYKDWPDEYAWEEKSPDGPPLVIHNRPVVITLGYRYVTLKSIRAALSTPCRTERGASPQQSTSDTDSRGSR